MLRYIILGALFYALTPSIFLRLPSGSSKKMVALTHAIVFVAAYYAAEKLAEIFRVKRTEGKESLKEKFYDDEDEGVKKEVETKIFTGKCTNGAVRMNGKCVTCPNGTKRINGKCVTRPVADPLANHQCAPGAIIINGKCVGKGGATRPCPPGTKRMGSFCKPAVQQVELKSSGKPGVQFWADPAPQSTGDSPESESEREPESEPEPAPKPKPKPKPKAKKSTFNIFDPSTWFN